MDIHKIAKCILSWERDVEKTVRADNGCNWVSISVDIYESSDYTIDYTPASKPSDY